MSRHATSLLVSLILLEAASITAIGTVCAGDPVGAAPAVRGPQIMLYVSQPLWSRGVSLRMYGLRMDRLRSVDSIAIQRTPLIDLQLQAHSDVRVEFGRRVTWDIRRGEFGPHSNSVYFQLPIKNSSLGDPLARPLGDPARFRTSPLAADIVPRQQPLGDRHPFEDAFIHSRWPLTESWGAREFYAPRQSTPKGKILSFDSQRCCAR